MPECHYVPRRTATPRITQVSAWHTNTRQAGRYVLLCICWPCFGDDHTWILVRITWPAHGEFMPVSTPPPCGTVPLLLCWLLVWTLTFFAPDWIFLACIIVCMMNMVGLSRILFAPRKLTSCLIRNDKNPLPLLWLAKSRLTPSS
jgi:hypothetical protein